MSAFFAPRMGRIKHSPSNATSQRVRELCAEGRDIIGLTIGEPDFPTPDNVKRAAAAARCGDHAALMKNMAKLQSQSTSNPCSVSRAAAVEALTGPQDSITTCACGNRLR